MQKARMQFNLSELHHMTETQMLTYRNHNHNASMYDVISIFSLQPPELLGAIHNPINYFQYCYIDDRVGYSKEQVRIH